MVFSNDQFFVLKLATIVGAILSLGGTLFIMLTFSKLKDKLNSLPNRIILYLSISDMLGSIGYLLDINNRANISKEDFMCFTSAVFQQYFPLSSFFWMACFSHNLYLIFCSKNIIQEEKIERNFHILCWGLPAITCIILAFTGSFGDAGIWCWITPDEQGMRFGTFYIPLIIIIIHNIIVYWKVWESEQKDRKDDMPEQLNKMKVRFLIYVAAFVFMRIWSIINRFQNLANKDNPIFFLYLMQAIFSPLQGFINALVYGSTPDIREYYKTACCNGEQPYQPSNHDDISTDSVELKGV